MEVEAARVVFAEVHVEAAARLNTWFLSGFLSSLSPEATLGTRPPSHLFYALGDIGPLVPPTGTVPGDDCPLVWGQCSHCFHMHCILKWLNAQQVQQHCPMCRQEWKFKE